MRLTEKEQTYKAVTFFEGDEPIGCADIEVVGDEIWLNNFAIREDYRGKGYCQKALMLAITECCRLCLQEQRRAPGGRRHQRHAHQRVHN